MAVVGSSSWAPLDLGPLLIKNVITFTFTLLTLPLFWFLTGTGRGIRALARPRAKVRYIEAGVRFPDGKLIAHRLYYRYSTLSTVLGSLVLSLLHSTPSRRPDPLSGRPSHS